MAQSTTTKSFHLHLEGYFGDFDSTAALQAHVADLKRDCPGLIGKTATVHAGYRRGDTTVYSGAGVQIVVSP